MPIVRSLQKPWSSSTMVIAGRRPARTGWRDPCASFCPPAWVTHRPVQKSPSLTVGESWLSTMVSSVMLTVPEPCVYDTRERPGTWDWSGGLD